MTITATALAGVREIEPGTDLAAAIADALGPPLDPPALQDGDVIVVAHKVVSKAEGRTRALSGVEVTERAAALAHDLGKDPRLVQVVLDESGAVLRAARGVLICVTCHGFVCANAGVDASNVPGEDTVVLLPRDPDGSARALRERLRELTAVAPAIVITDSFGRAWSRGQVDIAIGCAGLSPVEDWRGRTDTQGRQLQATRIAIADELAGAADLARTKDGGEPVVVIRGAGRHGTADDGAGAAAVIRPEPEDLFR